MCSPNTQWMSCFHEFQGMLPKKKQCRWPPVHCLFWGNKTLGLWEICQFSCWLTWHGRAAADPTDKVWHLLKSVKTHTLAAVKTQIMASETQHSNFDMCVNLFQNFIKQQHHNKQCQSNASVLGCASRGHSNYSNDLGHNKIQPNVVVEDQHCKKKECEKLSIEEKKGLVLKRVKCGHKPCSKDSTQPPKKCKKTFKNRAISAMKAHLKKHVIANDSSNGINESSNSKNEEVEMKTNNGPSNCKIKALKCKNTWQMPLEDLQCGSMHRCVEFKLMQKHKLVLSRKEIKVWATWTITCCSVWLETALIVADCKVPVSTSGHTDDVDRKICCTVTGAMANNDHQAKTWCLRCHQALEMPNLWNILVSPMQLRVNGIRANNEPKHMCFWTQLNTTMQLLLQPTWTMVNSLWLHCWGAWCINSP